MEKGVTKRIHIILYKTLDFLFLTNDFHESDCYIVMYSDGIK